MVLHNWFTAFTYIIAQTGKFLQWVSGAICLYYICVWLISGLKQWKRAFAKTKDVSVQNTASTGVSGTSGPEGRQHRFAVLIPAHNEEDVISNTIDSLKRQNYPKDLYDIYVIADNCSDKTAQRAALNGVYVYERKNPEQKGKGVSLKWMQEKLFAMDKEYDAICVLDADNLADPLFLREMNRHLCMGEKAIQGRIESKNPEDSWIAANHSILYWIASKLYHKPRYKLGMSCMLLGTGFVVDSCLLKKLDYKYETLTEDLELSLNIVLSGVQICWADSAVVYDEKPLTLKQSYNQRKRWMQGHWECALRYCRLMAAKSISKRDISSFDMLLYLLQPFNIILNCAVVLFTGISVLAGSGFSTVLNFPEIYFFVIAFLLIYANALFIVDKLKENKKARKYFLLFPIFNITWVPASICGFFFRKRKEWIHTVHTRSIALSDMEAMRQKS